MERVVKESLALNNTGHWRIWLHYPPNLSQGTILRLYDDGSADQVTLDEDGIESNYIKIKGPDK